MNMSEHRVLVADDDESIRFFMSEFLKKEGLSCVTVGDGESALEMLDESEFSLVIVDEKMPGMSGLDVIAGIKAKGLKMPVIMITAFGSRELAMKAINEGAYDFFTKPVDIDTVRTVIRRSLEKYDLQRENNALKSELMENSTKDWLVSESPAMRTAVGLVKKVADTDVTVFINGESGSGKELIARSIHKLSKRHESPFVSVNCAAIPEGLLESELFGFEKGAFTGAQGQHVGKFERANGGTIFLDEIGDLSLTLQAKLLRVLQDKVIERLGGKTPVKVDVRVISATNKNIGQLISQGAFREDLLYRIKVFEIEVPPLRKRKEDIPLITIQLIKKYSKEIGKDVTGISASALKMFLEYHWPGNVRELENIVQRAIIVEQGNIISVETLLGMFDETPLDEGELKGARHRFDSVKSEGEKKLITDALAKTKWKKQDAAKLLGISRKSLFLKMKKYGLM